MPFIIYPPKSECLDNFYKQNIIKTEIYSENHKKKTNKKAARSDGLHQSFSSHTATTSSFSLSKKLQYVSPSK